MKNYGKQLLRTPVQSALMIILIMIVTVMLSVGGNLWVASDTMSKAYEEEFITIGTVAQKPDTVQERKVWDAEKDDFLIYKDSVYNRYTEAEDLRFQGQTYLAGPERRVFWGSYVPEYVHMIETWGEKGWTSLGDTFLFAEFSPKEDCVPNESVKVQITRVLGSNKMMEGSVVWFCDHFNRYPQELKADKTYVAQLTQMKGTHGKRWEESASAAYGWELEFRPQAVVPTLYTPEGKTMDVPFEMQDFYEVTDGFYETEAGARILAAADMGRYIYDTQPVVGTDSTDLLMPFYEGSAWVYEGRYPTEEEYGQGSAVCLAPRAFAENNGLSVGDQVKTSLYFTNAKSNVGRVFFPQGDMSIHFSIFGLDGRILAPFEEKEYTIVGLYDYTPAVETIGSDELIVPLRSVGKPMENIVAFGAMTDYNTSFRIENGGIADFLQTSARYGADNLTFTFYDRGYSVLMEDIRNLKNMSATLLVMGLIAALILTLQISHIYITKQKRRMAVERLMGMTGKRCGLISLTGILILLLLGTVPGVAAGTALAGKIGADDVGKGDQQEAQKEDDAGIMETDAGQEEEETAVGTDTEETFSRKYSNLGLSVDRDIDLSGHNQGDPAVSCVMGALVLALGTGISGAKVRNLLRGEPLYLMDESIAGKKR